MERIIDLSVRHKDRLMAELMINENNNALEIEIFLLFFWPFQPLPAMVIMIVHAQCD